MRDPALDVDILTRNWWVFLLRGLAGIIFGIIAFVAPGISFAALVVVFGAYALADGVLALVSAIRRRGGRRWWMLVLEGVAGIAAGVATLLRKEIRGEWLLALGGLASIAFGVLVAFFPGPGALAIVLWLGAFALVFGVLMLVLSFRLRARGRRQTTIHHAAPSHA